MKLKPVYNDSEHTSLDDVCFLVPTTVSKDGRGQQLLVEGTPRQAFCSPTSISGTEFHNAAQNDIRPDIRLEVDNEEYDGERIVIYNEQKFNIYRTFVNKKNLIELYCTTATGVT